MQRSCLSPSLKVLYAVGRFLQYCGTIKRAVGLLVIVDSLPTCKHRIPIWNYNHCPRDFMFSLWLLWDFLSSGMWLLAVWLTSYRYTWFLHYQDTKHDSSTLTMKAAGSLKFDTNSSTLHGVTSQKTTILSHLMPLWSFIYYGWSIRMNINNNIGILDWIRKDELRDDNFNFRCKGKRLTNQNCIHKEIKSLLLFLGSACRQFSSGYFLSSHLLYKIGIAI